MKDITNVIKEVVSSNVLWGVEVFYMVVDQLRNKGYIISFWGNEENWTSILVGIKVIEYLWKKYPLAFVVSNHSNDIRILLKEHDCVTLI